MPLKGCFSYAFCLIFVKNIFAVFRSAICSVTILHRPQYVSKSCVRRSGDALMCNLHKFPLEFSTSPQMKHFRTIRPFSFSPFGNNRLFLSVLPFLPYFTFSVCFGLSSLFSRPDLALNIGGAARERGSEGASGGETSFEKFLPRTPSSRTFCIFIFCFNRLRPHSGGGGFCFGWICLTER